MHPQPTAHMPPRTPTPQPRTPQSTGLLYIHLAEDTANWCLITHGTNGDTTQTGSTRNEPKSADERNINNAALAALEEALKIATPENRLSLYVYNFTVRTCIASLGSSLPNITLACTSNEGDLEKARGLTTPPETPTQEQPARPATPILISTDASKRTRGRAVGLGWIINWGDSEGPELGSVAAKAPDILCAELMAIEQAARVALASHPTPDQVIRIECDSRDAITSLNRAPGLRPEKLTATQRTILSRIISITDGYAFEFTWVKGHAQNQMNIIADRLAVAARRNAELHIPPAARETILDGIMEAAREVLANTHLKAAA